VYPLTRPARSARAIEWRFALREVAHCGTD